MDEENLVELLTIVEPVNIEESAAIIANAIAISSLAPVYIGLYLTVLSGYLIAAYIAGSELKLKQVKLINSVFVISSIFFAGNAMFVFIASNTSLLEQAISDTYRSAIYGWLIFDFLIFIIMIVGIFACLNFMKDVRRSSEMKGT